MGNTTELRWPLLSHRLRRWFTDAGGPSPMPMPSQLCKQFYSTFTAMKEVVRKCTKPNFSPIIRHLFSGATSKAVRKCTKPNFSPIIRIRHLFRSNFESSKKMYKTELFTNHPHSPSFPEQLRKQ
jgi:hypothetical protein